MQGQAERTCDLVAFAHRFPAVDENIHIDPYRLAHTPDLECPYPLDVPVREHGAPDELDLALGQGSVDQVAEGLEPQSQGRLEDDRGHQAATASSITKPRFAPTIPKTTATLESRSARFSWALATMAGEFSCLPAQKPYPERM